MLSFLEKIADVVLSIGIYVLSAMIEGLNLIFDGVGAGVALVFSILPSMPDVTGLGTPEWLEWMNWFYPVGAVVSGLVAVIVLFLVWMGVRYFLQLARAA